MAQQQRQLPKEAPALLNCPTLRSLKILSHAKVVEKDLFQCYPVPENGGFQQNFDHLYDLVELQLPPPPQGCHQQELRVALPLPSYSTKKSYCCQEAFKGRSSQIIAVESYLIVEER